MARRTGAKVGNKATTDYSIYENRKVLPFKLNYRATVHYEGKVDMTERDMRWALEDELDLWEKDGFPTIAKFVREKIEEQEGADAKQIDIVSLGVLKPYECHHTACKSGVKYTVDGKYSCERHMLAAIAEGTKPEILPSPSGKMNEVDQNASLEIYFPLIKSDKAEAPKSDEVEA